MRWGILATGNIAAQMAAALPHVAGASLAAVGSRSLASAERFVAAHGTGAAAHGSYQALLDDPTVEAVYIATPHDSHHEWTMKALHAGKDVLCEKPMALRASDARTSAALAKARGLFLMEAVWTRFLPAIQRIKALVEAGAIGRPRLLSADFCVRFPFDPTHRLYDPARGGGAMLDLGLYPLTMAQHLLGDLSGEPTHVAGTAELGETGVDELAVLALRYASGAVARLAFSQRFDKPAALEIVGEAGRVTVPERFLAAQGFEIVRDGRAEWVDAPMTGNGYAHEVIEVERCVAAGLVESSVMPLDQTIATLAVMDGLRAEWGVRYPGDT